MIYPVINDVALELETHPSLFSPARPDPGTLGMLAAVELRPDDKVLDLGCGYGLVGIYAAKRLGSGRVVMSDNDPLAVEVAGRNTVRNGVDDIQLFLSDGFANIPARDFTLILSNPPYHVDFAVPKGFIEGAFRHLDVGGRLVMVVKRLAWYQNKMRSIFGGVRVAMVDEYAVLESEKRSARHQAKPVKTTTKKHRRRLAASARNKGR